MDETARDLCEAWWNGNRADVMAAILYGKDTAQVAWMACRVYHYLRIDREDARIFMRMLESRIDALR